MDQERVHRHYRSPFLLDRSKLTRLDVVITAKLVEQSADHENRFVVLTAKERGVETSSLAEVFNVDNTDRNPIEHLLVRRSVKTPDDKAPAHEVRVDFDGERPVDVTVTVTSANQKWAMETLAVVEEQIERALRSDPIHRVLNNRMFWPWTALLAVFTAYVAVVLFVSIGSRSMAGPAQMWLKEGDLQEFREILAKEGTLSLDRVGQLIGRQVRNVAEQYRPGISSARWTLLRVSSLVAPLALVVGSLMYMALTCYPLAVFLWGDREESYARVVARRRTIWSVVIGSMFVGVLANLFVFGVSADLASR